MVSVVRRRTTCRLCDKNDLAQVLELSPSPLANSFVSVDCVEQVQNKYPLELCLCRSCGHAQLRVVIDPDALFRDYLYVSSTSSVFVEHFRKYVDDVLTDLSLPKMGLVVDIGSNDGILLSFFKARELRVLGVDPAHDIARKANEVGIKTLPEFFTGNLAKTIKQDYGDASIITANNVFAHVDDLAGMTCGIRELLAPDGVFVFEVSYLLDVIEKTLFDTIYHEHLSYHSVIPLRVFFERQGMELIEARRVPSHGGSLRGIVQHRGGPRPVSPSVATLAKREEQLGIHDVEVFHAFSENLDRLKTELAGLLRELREQGKVIAGYGAPAKATTLLFHFNLGDVLDFIVDDSPLKQNRFTPGHHVPVLPSQAIYERRPDYLLILAWNFAEAIMDNHQAFQDGGGHFIVPLPKIEIR